MKNIKFNFLLALAALLTVQLMHTVAESKKNLHAHTHGHAEMSIAIEGKSVEVEFKSPNDNILGFEHTPTTDLEKKSVVQMKAELEKSFEALMFPANANCKLQTKKITFEFPEKDNPHESEDHEDHGHSEAEMEFEYTCLNPEMLKSVECSIFKRFPTIQKIKVSAVNGEKQFSDTLSPKKTSLNLNQ